MNIEDFKNAQTLEEKKSFIINYAKDMAVHFSPLYDKDNNQLKNHKLIRRDKDNSPVTIVTNRYKIFQHEDAITDIFNALDDAAANYEINSFMPNKKTRYNRLHMTLTFPEIEFDVDGSLTRASLDVYNSTDGTMSYMTRFGAFRLVCSNGMIIGKKLFFEKSRHMIKMEPENLYNKFEILSKELDGFKELLEKSQEARVTKEFTKALLKGGFPNRIIDNLPMLYESYKKQYQEQMGSALTVWAAYNVLTNWLSNNVEKKSIQRAYDMNVKLTNIIGKFI